MECLLCPGMRQCAGTVAKLESTPRAESKLCYSLVKFKSTARRRKTAAENREVQVNYLGTIYFVWE